VKEAPISCHQNTTLGAAFGCEGGSHVLPLRYHLVVMGSLSVFSPKGRGFVLLKGWLSLRVTQSTHGADKVKVLARWEIEHVHKENSFQTFFDKFILWFYVIYLTKFVSYSEWVYVKGICDWGNLVVILMVIINWCHTNSVWWLGLSWDNSGQE